MTYCLSLSLSMRNLVVIHWVLVPYSVISQEYKLNIGIDRKTEHKNNKCKAFFTLYTSFSLRCFSRNNLRTCFFFSSAFILERLGLYIIKVRPIWPTATELVASSNCFTTSSNSSGQLRCIFICKCNSNWSINKAN